MGRPLKFDVDKFMNHFSDALKETAEWAAGELQYAYEDAITAFYNDYSPHSYRRTFATYQASSGHRKSPSQLVIKNGKFNFEAGIKVDPGNIHGTPYYHYVDGHKTPQDTAFIFDNTFDKGLHGYNGSTFKQFYNKYFSDEIVAGKRAKWKHRMVVEYQGKKRKKRNATPPISLMEKSYKAIGRQIASKMSAAISGISL